MLATCIGIAEGNPETMRKVTRAEIVDYQTYNDQRDAIRQDVLEIKRQRRVLVGDCLNFLFETTDTIRYQIQEMMLAERMVREADIQHELDTYNELLTTLERTGVRRVTPLGRLTHPSGPAAMSDKRSKSCCGSTGLTRWRSKPASSALRRSSGWP